MKKKRTNTVLLGLTFVLATVLVILLGVCVALYARQGMDQTDPTTTNNSCTALDATSSTSPVENNAGQTEPVPTTEYVGSDTDVSTQPNQNVPQGNNDFNGVVKTPYGDLMISPDNCDRFRYVESSDEGVAVEVFYMLLANRELEVFRLYYGNKNIGDMVGYLETNAGMIPVTVSACSYETDTFADSDEIELYQCMMGELNGLLRQIREDPRFRPYDEVDLPDMGKIDTQISYWTFSIPEGMALEESNSGSIYQADFYGIVAGERINFYSVFLGEKEADTLLGYYTVDGLERPVWVESCDLEPSENWTDEDLAHAYTLLSSINDVIQTIMSSEGFSDLPREQ